MASKARPNLKSASRMTKKPTRTSSLAAQFCSRRLSHFQTISPFQHSASALHARAPAPRIRATAHPRRRPAPACSMTVSHAHVPISASASAFPHSNPASASPTSASPYPPKGCGDNSQPGFFVSMPFFTQNATPRSSKRGKRVAFFAFSGISTRFCALGSLMRLSSVSFCRIIGI